MMQYEPVFLADVLKESTQQGTTPSLTVVSNSMSLDDDELELETIDKSNTLYRQKGRKLSARLLRRANYLWASILASYVDSFLFSAGQG